MAIESGGKEAKILSPDEAFGVLGNEIRIEILRTLGAADRPLSFTELRDSVGLRRGGQFTYHLDKVVGHFVEKTDEGYALRRPGERIVEAVLSGAVTEKPVLERTEIDQPCQLCGAPIEVEFGDRGLKLFCTDCSGMWQGEGSVPDGYLGRKLLPPAGLQRRTPADLYDVAWTWTNLELFAIASEICPRCSATLDVEKSVCDDHDATGEVCPTCEHRYPVRVQVQCTNCIFGLNGSLPIYLLSETDLIEFLTSHGYHPISPEFPAEVHQVLSDYDIDVRSVAPFEARVTFTLGDETLTLTVDTDLSVTGTQRESA